MTESTKSGTPDGTYAELLRDLRDRFRAGGIPDWEASAEWLAVDAFECTRTELFSHSDRVPKPHRIELLRQWAARRLQREPVQYILGYTEFCGLRLHVDSRVLIPRPETELLVERVVEAASALNSPIRVLDVGTGSGCIALAVAKLLPGAEVWGVESSGEALEVARMNAKALDLNVQWVKGDIGEGLHIEEPFTIVVSNPPYIPQSDAGDVMPEVAVYEPHAALFVEGDALTFYRMILASCDQILTHSGHVYFEVNPDFASEIEELMRRRHGFAATGIELDLAQRQRIVWGRRNG